MKLVVFSVIISLTISGLIFGLSLDMYLIFYDPDWRGIINPKIVDETNKIFLIGNSQTNPISSTYITDFLHKNNENYYVYNLANPGDRPNQRIKYLESIISAKPTLVVYGVGFLEFLDKTPPKIDIFDSQNNTVNSFLEPSETFWKIMEFVSNDTFNIEVFESGISPKEKTLLLIKYVLRGPDHPYHPFIGFTDKKVSDVQSARTLSNFDFSANGKDVQALHEIIDKLRENDIKVIIFTEPYNRAFLNNIEKPDHDDYRNFLNELSNTISVHDIHEKYADSNQWTDDVHLAVGIELEINDDLSEIILDELNAVQ